jgi:hypothetical protein
LERQGSDSGLEVAVMLPRPTRVQAFVDFCTALRANQGQGGVDEALIVE